MCEYTYTSAEFMFSSGAFIGDARNVRVRLHQCSLQHASWALGDSVRLDTAEEKNEDANTYSCDSSRRQNAAEPGTNRDIPRQLKGGEDRHTAEGC